MGLQAILLTLVAFVGGGFIALQAPINAQAATHLGSPIAAATLSFCVGTVALILLTALFARSETNLGAIAAMPVYMIFAGGLLGAGFVTMTIVLAPKIGIAAVMALAIAGQLFTALLLDRFALFDLLERDLSVGRVTGAVLVVVGALMVRLL
ncbi:DMT family transporter [Methyloligella solikamskensis]|uniref:DMT family transporter n=1 Tax=Methyloligella solikamskensis TaxID=1177756 RepID=A0ABW3JAY4_9HYPH